MIPIVRPASSLGDQSGAQVLDEVVEDRLETLRIPDVLVERLLAGLRDDLPFLGHRRVVLESRAALELGREARTEVRRQLLVLRGRQRR